jgi:hypothetical protein
MKISIKNLLDKETLNKLRNVKIKKLTNEDRKKIRQENKYVRKIYSTRNKRWDLVGNWKKGISSLIQHADNNNKKVDILIGQDIFNAYKFNPYTHKNDIKTSNNYIEWPIYLNSVKPLPTLSQD